VLRLGFQAGFGWMEEFSNWRTMFHLHLTNSTDMSALSVQLEKHSRDVCC
jgi:hypothetical protein